MTRASKKETKPQRGEWKLIGRGPRGDRGAQLPLETLRIADGLTQAQVATAMKVNQGDVSRIEAREDLTATRVGTLQRYVEALGGKLHLVADFGNHNFHIVGKHPSRKTKSRR